VVAKSTIELLAEIQWPGTVDIATGIVHIGNSSILIAANLYQNNLLVATSETMVFQVNTITKKTHPIDNAIKEKLNRYTIKMD
jgi:acyl-CoA thioester hydrolase